MYSSKYKIDFRPKNKALLVIAEVNVLPKNDAKVGLTCTARKQIIALASRRFSRTERRAQNA